MDDVFGPPDITQYDAEGPPDITKEGPPDITQYNDESDKDIAVIGDTPDWTEGSGKKDVPTSTGVEKTDYSQIISKAVTTAGTVASTVANGANKTSTSSGGSGGSSAKSPIPVAVSVSPPAPVAPASKGLSTGWIVAGCLGLGVLAGGVIYLAVQDRPRRRSLAEGIRP